MNESDSTIARIAQIIPATEAEGPGVRFAVWFQGCPLRCPGCCNPEFLPFRGGDSWPIVDIIAALDSAREAHPIEGISLLGGEPFAHVPAGIAMAKAARERRLSVMIYSGYTLEELRLLPEPASELLAITDVLVDGPYLREQPETERRWVGSTNQRVHLFTDFYRPDDPCWRQKNTLEIRVDRLTVTVNGFPTSGEAAGLWKGWKRPARKASESTGAK